MAKNFDSGLYLWPFFLVQLFPFSVSRHLQAAARDREGKGRGGEGKGKERKKKEEGEVRTRNRTERNGTERIQTDRIVSDRITALHGGERTDRDQNGWQVSGERYRYYFSVDTRIYVKVTLTVQRGSYTCWCFMVSMVRSFTTKRKVKIRCAQRVLYT